MELSPGEDKENTHLALTRTPPPRLVIALTDPRLILPAKMNFPSAQNKPQRPPSICRLRTSPPLSSSAPVPSEALFDPPVPTPGPLHGCFFPLIPLLARTSEHGIQVTA